MSKEYELTITVNYPNATEHEFQAASMGTSLGEVINMSLELNGVLETDYSSLVIVVTGNAKEKPKPSLRVVS